MKFFKKFKTEAEYNAYISGTEKLVPCVSYISDTKDTKYNMMEGIIISGLTWTSDISYSGGTGDASNCTYFVIAKNKDGQSFDVTELTEAIGSVVVTATSTYDRTSAGMLNLTFKFSTYSATASVEAFQEGDTIPRSVSLIGLTWVNNIPWTGGTADKSKCTYTVYGQYIDRTLNITSAATMSGEIIVPETALYERHSIGNLTIEAELSGLTSSGSVEGLQEGVTLNMIDFSGVTWKNGKFGQVIPYNGGSITLNDFNYQVLAAYANSTVVDVTSAATMSLVGLTAISATTIYTTRSFDSTTQLKAVYSGKTNFSNDVGAYQEGLPCVEIWNYNMNNSYTVNFTKANKIQYSKNSGFTWTTLTSTSNTVTITARQSVLFRGCSGTTTLGGGRFIISGPNQDIWLQGNIMGLLGPNYTEQPVAASAFTGTFSGCSALWTMDDTFFRHMTTTAPYSCYKMFYGCDYLVSASKLLPALTAATHCYESMFAYSHLAYIPDIAATTLETQCCDNMFAICNNLYDVSNHTLPAATAQHCYIGMFYNCANLIKAPYLPATVLAHGSYMQMFEGCYNLNEIHCDATDISAGDCKYRWLRDVASTGDFYGKIAANWPDGENGIPVGWTKHLE